MEDDPIVEQSISLKHKDNIRTLPKLAPQVAVVSMTILFGENLSSSATREIGFGVFPTDESVRLWQNALLVEREMHLNYESRRILRSAISVRTQAFTGGPQLWSEDRLLHPVGRAFQAGEQHRLRLSSEWAKLGSQCGKVLYRLVLDLIKADADYSKMVTDPHMPMHL